MNHFFQKTASRKTVTMMPVILFFIFLLASCTQEVQFTAGFDNTNDRIWPGKDFWSVPLEDWKIENGRLHCTGNIPDSRVNLLTQVIAPGQGNFEVTVNISLDNRGDSPGNAGLMIGIHDREDPDVRAACYFGKGLNAGVSLEGFAFLGNERAELNEDFNFENFQLKIDGSNSRLRMEVSDNHKKNNISLTCDTAGIHGLIAVANNMAVKGRKTRGNSNFSFSNLQVSGSKIISTPENAFGPVLWTMYTLSEGNLILMALMPPLGEQDKQDVSLQFNNGGVWETAATENIEPDSRTAVFRLKNHDSTKDTEYRIVYISREKDGTETPEYFTGTIRKDPVDRPLKFGALTCQYSSGFPYTPLVKNLAKSNPDMLYFSGDQIYEANGGYPIRRMPEEVSILNYLGKYYMFGWAFGDLMRDRPTLCTPDDHDVFHGNLWGEAGEAMDASSPLGTVGGYLQSPEMVNVVIRTQCGQLPDPYDPAPVKQGINVWYTSLKYGRISFAVISDRQFKSGPENITYWEGRNDHLKEKPENPAMLDKPGLEMIGERQLKFLNDWILDWENTDMKVLLSQTVFANAATHHGSKDSSFDGYLLGDLDSGGWPKSGRDKVVELMRKGAVFHINGDQHLPTIIQYGLKEYRDAGYSFCTPPISNIYVRWFLPDEMGYPVSDRPAHGYPNTGKYTDAFGNKNFVYAVGNPGDIITDPDSRYNQSQLRVSGFGMVTFDKQERTINMDSWRFLADLDNTNPIRDQYPGWPVKISQFDNFGMNAQYVLPQINVNIPGQLVRVWNEKTGGLEQIFRINGLSAQPKLHEGGTFTIMVGEGEATEKFTGIKTELKNNSHIITVNL